MHTLPSHFKLAYSEEMIEQRIAEMAVHINCWAVEVAARHQSDLLAVPVLRGALFFAADLLRHITASVHIAPSHAWAYHTQSNTPREVVEAQLDPTPVKNRAVLLIDDICDSGRTLAHLAQKFTAAGAVEVRSAVLITRELLDTAYTPHYVGIHHRGSEWFVGYGMDDKGSWRNLRALYVIGED